MKRLTVTIAVLLFAGSARGGAWYVDSANGSNSFSGTSGAPLATITRAMELAAGGDVIYVQRGRYTVPNETFPIMVKNGVSIVGLSPGVGGIVVDAAETGRVFQCATEITMATRIEGLTIEGGLAASPIGQNAIGGAILCTASAAAEGHGRYLTIARNIIRENAARATRVSGSTPPDHAAGGGIYVTNTLILGNAVHNNIAEAGHTSSAVTAAANAYGGAIAGEWNRIVHNSIYNNEARGGDCGRAERETAQPCGSAYGGAVYDVSADVLNNIMVANTAHAGEWTQSSFICTGPSSFGAIVPSSGDVRRNGFRYNRVTFQGCNDGTVDDFGQPRRPRTRIPDYQQNSSDLDAFLRFVHENLCFSDPCAATEMVFDPHPVSPTASTLAVPSETLAYDLDWTRRPAAAVIGAFEPRTLRGDVKFATPEATDLLWQNTQGNNFLWYRSESAGAGEGWRDYEGSQNFPSAGNSAWRIISSSDFNADTYQDLLWQHALTGQLYLWYLDPVRPEKIGEANVNNLGSPAWKVVSVNDFILEDARRPDILFQHQETSQLYLWQMNGNQLVSGLNVNSLGAGWNVVGSADFDRDASPDLVFHNPSTGALKITYMLANQRRFVADLPGKSTEWRVAAVFDEVFPADSYARLGWVTMIWQHTPTGNIERWGMADRTLASTLVGLAWPEEQVGSADWKLTGPR